MTEVGSHKWQGRDEGGGAGALKDFSGSERAPPRAVGTFTLERKECG